MRKTNNLWANQLLPNGLKGRSMRKVNRWKSGGGQFITTGKKKYDILSFGQNILLKSKIKDGFTSTFFSLAKLPLNNSFWIHYAMAHNTSIWSRSRWLVKRQVMMWRRVYSVVPLDNGGGDTGVAQVDRIHFCQIVRCILILQWIGQRDSKTS